MRRSSSARSDSRQGHSGPCAQHRSVDGRHPGSTTTATGGTTGTGSLLQITWEGNTILESWANSGIAPRDSLTNHKVTGERILAFPCYLPGLIPERPYGVTVTYTSTIP